MVASVANPHDRFAIAPDDEANFRKFLAYSIVLHSSLAILIAASVYFRWNSQQWSGTGSLGDATHVGLVSSAGLPLPKPAVVAPTQVVDPTKSLYKEEPPQPPEPKTVATPIPKFDKEKRLPPSPKSKIFENKTPPPPNAVPGHGGTPDIPSGLNQSPGSGAGGVATHQQAGGEFESRYPWYIAAAKRRVAPNWNVLFLDPAVRNSRTLHCVISFTILRDGSVKNLRVSESSGNLSWDNSGLRAIQSSIPFPPLPSDWTAPEVSVLWDFPDIQNP
ncbi:MAG TPA: TonB family protein [Candidatus Binatus sp.]|jgi:TonB family protein|nr:TonB family protein [Candidatus Binatus sp.]